MDKVIILLILHVVSWAFLFLAMASDDRVSMTFMILCVIHTLGLIAKVITKK